MPSKINIYLDNGWRYKWEQLTRTVEDILKAYAQPLVILFTENALKYKHTKEEMQANMGMLERLLKPQHQVHVCFPAFVFEDKYSANHVGYVVSAQHGEVSIQSYTKHLMSQWDSFNMWEPYSIFGKELSKKVRCGATGIPSRCGLDKEKRYQFPVIEINGMSLEFRICNDVLLKSATETDVCLVSSNGIPDSYLNRHKPKVTIVNDFYRKLVVCGGNQKGLGDIKSIIDRYQPRIIGGLNYLDKLKNNIAAFFIALKDTHVDLFTNRFYLAKSVITGLTKHHQQQKP